MKLYEAGSGHRWTKSKDDMVRAVLKDVWQVGRFQSWEVHYEYGGGFSQLLSHLCRVTNNTNGPEILLILSGLHIS